MPTLLRPLTQLGVSEMTLFFWFRDQGIAAIFEPHLKCTRDLFLKYEVMNVGLGFVNGQPHTGTTKWSTRSTGKNGKTHVHHATNKSTTG